MRERNNERRASGPLSSGRPENNIHHSPNTLHCNKCQRAINLAESAR
ncbi:hypothetical protein QLX08_000587 [Tetragonisca angustula]|uniref:Uncharacterized protein n=1 Tax=Tetragonisca angustula TaxID=166442 RepID=A0AAW1AJI5_9HYME